MSQNYDPRNNTRRPTHAAETETSLVSMPPADIIHLHVPGYRGVQLAGGAKSYILDLLAIPFYISCLWHITTIKNGSKEMPKGKITCEVCGKEIATGNKLCPECEKTPKAMEEPKAKNDYEMLKASSISVLRDVARSNKGVSIRKNTLCYILLSLMLHPVAFVVMSFFLNVPFLIIPCLYCVIAIILGVRAIKLMETNRIHRAYIITFGVLNFSIFLGIAGLTLIVQLLRSTANHII
jgi:hypothetical protein